MPDPKPRPRKICDIRADMGEAKRDKFLECIKEGASIMDACRGSGMNTDANYRYHRRTHPNWAAQVDHARNVYREQKASGEEPGTPLLPFGEFAMKWFPDRRPHLPHPLRIAAELENLRPREVAMFLLWPEAGKTATLEDYICRTLAIDPSQRFRYVSEAADLSKRVVGTIQRRFTDDTEYGPFLQRYGPFYEKGQERMGRPWTTEQISIAKNPGTERDRNLVASSWTSAVYGSRIDTLILDDLQSQRNYNQAEEIFRRIRGTFFNRGIVMRTLIIGTRIGPGDFYERMLDAGLITRQIVLPAMRPDREPMVPEFWDQDIYHDGGPCCAGFRDCPRDGSRLTPREFMELIRHQSGEETWAASYMQNPQANTLSTFAEYLDRCLDRNREYGALVRS